jgi:tetratricopeptide (TPR) repeat protein
LTNAFKEHAEETKMRAADLIKKQRYEDAATVYEQCMKIAQESGDKKLIEEFKKELEKALTLYAKHIESEAKTLYSTWKYEDAAKLYNKAVEIAKESKRKVLVTEFTKAYDNAIEKWASSKIVKGNEHEVLREYEEAIKNYEESLKIIEQAYDDKLIDQFIKMVYSIYMKIAEKIKEKAEALFNIGEYEKAVDNFDVSVRLADLTQDKKKLTEYRRKRDQALDRVSVKS